MSTDRVTTRSKNASQHPGLLVPKQTRRTTQEVSAIREAKENLKKEKELTRRAGIKRVAVFEKGQADDDAIEQTPRVMTKPRPLVCTHSYANVLHGDYSGNIDGQSAEPDSAFEMPVGDAADGQTTESAASDGMETVVEQPLAPPRKKITINKKDQKGKAPGVRDAIKAIQDAPEKKGKHKKSKESSDSESMKIDATPMPKKKIRRRVPSTETDDDLPAGPPKRAVCQLTMRDEEEDSEDLPSKIKGKWKSKERCIGIDHLGKESRNVSKSAISHLIRTHHLLPHVRVFTNIERIHALLLFP